MSISVFAAAPSTITTFNGTISISNVTKTGDIHTDKSFDRAKTNKALEVAESDFTIENTYELYYCAGAPVTITFNKLDDGNYGISSYNSYCVDEASIPTLAVTKYDVSVFDAKSGKTVPAQAFKGTITLNKPGSYYLYANNRSLISTDCDAGIYIVVGDGSVTEPTTPAVSTVNAVPTASNVLVNGKVTSFDAYTINGNNYFKLRDLAKVVSGTEKQFEVSWDGSKNAINLVSNKPYTAVGGELGKGDGTSKAATLSTATIYKDGVKVALTAYTINGNNYFKLRDVAQAFDIGVTWDGATSTVGIDTTTGYAQ
jgi:hypothetical protein